MQWLATQHGVARLEPILPGAWLCPSSEAHMLISSSFYFFKQCINIKGVGMFTRVYCINFSINF